MERNEIKIFSNEIITSGEAIANHLNQHFSEISVKLSSVVTQNHNVRPEMFLKQSQETFEIHIIATVFERLVYDQLYAYLIHDNLIDSRQS
jgi:hypothetical protein